ncbi:N-6 DNA methylase [uncultured Prochlorococcus sp.]|uniref:N-6 DNA methylase n=1 Tax=uncultured Prochlorococcus sp. TaxID=159733 RepID=UPI00258DD444|nr:N-6 DNA methylase [uncultured Prochlorococcus sp.]
MLDSVTKKRIDDLRNILVGKIPSPQSQVEQITTGLIYKFMHDMDNEAIEMGGVPSFFIDEYEKYSWKHLFNTKLGGVERVKLYGDAIENLYNNPNAPSIFREIFKNSFLPFKDPSTLNMFLKEINEFHYSNSEQLGDAYEYLLSFMGSQGDAGQFRTPRHIIDFIIQIVNPQKNEKILDPACGTSGFLISSYRHILSQNTQTRIGDKLNASERKQIGENLVGYDIDPSMTRISLVNMYLHNFASPQIHEYDTLSSEDRWNEYYDVILANPPFFSPTGGIQPHTRFGVRSTRAEVLFVDYIMEHLKPTGRGGIVVPEGIIFQTGNAYKTLRKKLVEDCLVGVISLPAGVFQPYSGVKTSILILDKELNQKSDSIFFAKVENDGFSLGAQRTVSSKNDLPIVSEQFKHFCNETTASTETVPKQVILDSADFSLSLSKFQTVEVISDFDVVKLRELVEVLDSQRKPLKKADRVEGKYPYYGATGVIDYVNNYLFEEQLVLIGEDGAKWGSGENSAFIADGQYWVNNHAHVVRPKRDKLLDVYLTNVLNFMDLNPFITGVTVPKLNQANLLDIEIPLPPIEVQQQIVDELEGYQKIIDGCRQVVENYKPTIDIDPSWEMVELNEVCSKITDGTHKTPKYTETGIPFLRVTDITKTNDSKKFISLEEHQQLIQRCNPEKGDIIYSKNGTIGVAALVDWDYEFSIFVSLCLLKPKNEIIDSDYLAEILNTSFVYQQALNFTKSGTVSNLHLVEIKNIKIPLPNLETQIKIVDVIRKEKNHVYGVKTLKDTFLQKIQDRISKVWGE